MNGPKAAMKRYREGNAEESKTISELLKNAVQLCTDHIWKEDYLLFPMSEKILSSQDRETLAKDFGKAQEKFASGCSSDTRQLLRGSRRV